MLRFKRRIGPSYSVLGNPIQRPPPTRRFPDFAERIGRRFTVFFGIAVIPPLMHRTWCRGFLLICCSKTR